MLQNLVFICILIFIGFVNLSNGGLKKILDLYILTINSIKNPHNSFLRNSAFMDLLPVIFSLARIIYLLFSTYYCEIDSLQVLYATDGQSAESSANTDTTNVKSTTNNSDSTDNNSNVSCNTCGINPKPNPQPGFNYGAYHGSNYEHTWTHENQKEYDRVNICQYCNKDIKDVHTDNKLECGDCLKGAHVDCQSTNTNETLNLCIEEKISCHDEDCLSDCECHNDNTN